MIHKGDDETPESNNFVKSFVSQNLSKSLPFLKKNVDTLEEYFLLQDMLDCRQAAYFATREDPLTSQELKEYQKTWLHRQNVTVVELCTLVPVLKDGISECYDTDDKTETSIVRWNFPIMGEIFIDVLTKFVTKQTDNEVKQACQKVTGFAGFWYKHLFFKCQAEQITSVTY